jgi:hypothetical protein
VAGPFVVMFVRVRVLRCVFACGTQCAGYLTRPTGLESGFEVGWRRKVGMNFPKKPAFQMQGGLLTRESVAVLFVVYLRVARNARVI